MPSGEYFTSYEERMGLIRWRIERVALVLGLPIPLIAPFVLTGELVSVFTLVFIFGIAVLGLHVMLSYAGEIVLAQGAFMAIGAYTASRVVNEAGLGLLPAMLIAGLMTASVATAFGLPAGRVKGSTSPSRRSHCSLSPSSSSSGAASSRSSTAAHSSRCPAKSGSSVTP
ncbi:ABC transporter permease subunit [Halovenus salina]|uniref:Branched-chain amino acid ABC transporter permease n=1 Tax=Halovenus salina TaxID=1510225 RepID=A0ABD5VXE4_9EURY